MKKTRIAVVTVLFAILTATLYGAAQFLAEKDRLPPERYGNPALVAEVPK